MGKRHEHAAARPYDTRQLAQSLGVARLLDVLEHRDRVRVVEGRVLERQRAAVGDPQLEPGHVARQRPPRLDLPLELVDRRHTDALPREHDGQQLGAGEIEDALARPRAQLLDRPGQLEIAARIERDDDTHDRLAAIPMPNQMRTPSLTLSAQRLPQPRTNKPLQPVITLAAMSGAAAESIWTEAAIADLRRELGDVYEGRTVLVTGADGFMGSHLTDALVELGANVTAFVRATSSGALNNIGHLRSRIRVSSPTSPTVPRSTTSSGS